MNIGHYVKSALRWTTRKGSGNPIVNCEAGTQVCFLKKLS